MQSLKYALITGLCMLFSVCYAQEEVLENNATSQGKVRLEAVNPHSKGTAPLVVGWVLTGDGAVGFVLGLTHIYENLYAQSGQRSLGQTLDNVFLIEGAIQMAIGIPFIISGTIKHGEWKKWEIEHGNLKISYTGSRIEVDF